MKYTKNMWDTWKDWRLDETPEDELTELIKEFIKQGVDNLDEVTLPPFSSPEAKEQIDRDMIVMSKYLGKASQQVIKIMMDGVKGGKYDAMDLARGIQIGPVKRTHFGEIDFIKQLWTKVRDGFRRYSKRGKLR